MRGFSIGLNLGMWLIFAILVPVHVHAEADQTPCERVASIMNRINSIEPRAVLQAYGIDNPASCVFDRDTTLLHYAAESKLYPAKLNVLIEMGANPDMLNYHGLTPIGSAVLADSAASVETLFKYGNAHKIQNFREDTPLLTRGYSASFICGRFLERLPNHSACNKLRELEEKRRDQ